MKHERLKELLTLTMLGAMMFGGKMAMAALPNIEPVSLLILVYTLVFGIKALYAVYVYVGLEILLWGIGLWNLNYLYVWPILVLLGLMFRRMESPLGWAILSGAFGLAFGALSTPVYCITGGFGFGFSWWVSGIPFDVMHCVGNFAMALLLLKPLRKILTTLRNRYLPQ